jgi:hypothetical protein
MISQRRSAIIIVLLAGAVSAFASTDSWKQFHGKGFSVMYPGTWFELAVSPDRLDLLSSKHGHLHALVVKYGYAGVTVSEAPKSTWTEGTPLKTLAQVMDYYTKDGSVLWRRVIPGEPGGQQGCNDLKEVVVKDAVVPPEDLPTGAQVSYFIDTNFFCEADGHKIVISLKNWEGDKRQEQYQEVALRMAKSIRILK